MFKVILHICIGELVKLLGEMCGYSWCDHCECGNQCECDGC